MMWVLWLVIGLVALVAAAEFCANANRVFGWFDHDPGAPDIPT